MRRIFYLIVLFSTILMMGCQEEGYVLLPIYGPDYSVEGDTTLTAASHDYILYLENRGDIKSSDPSVGLNLPLEWDYNKPESLWSDLSEWNEISNQEITDTTVAYDWIKVEQVSINGKPGLRISVQENTSDSPRAVQLLYDVRYEHEYYIASCIVKQNGRPDMEPFEMKMRYKGNTYTTMARLNLSEEIVIENPEYKDMVNRIEAMEDIEVIVQEDGIVDYLDASDMEVKPALAQLRRNVDASTRCNVLPFQAPTRAKDAFRYMTEGALGYYGLFDDKDFDDSAYGGNFTSLDDVKDIDYMRDIGLNDKVTSLAVAYNGDNAEVCAVLTVWEDSYFNHDDNDRTKHRISFIASKDNPRISWGSLKNIKCIGSSNSWNDRISSFSFHFGYYGRQLKPY